MLINYKTPPPLSFSESPPPPTCISFCCSTVMVPDECLTSQNDMGRLTGVTVQKTRKQKTRKLNYFSMFIEVPT